MITRMLFQSWRYGLKRKLLAIMTIFLAAGLVSALLAVSIDIGDKMARELKSYGANILIEPASSAVLSAEINGGNSLSTQDFLDEKELPNVKDIFWRNNIVGFAPLLSAEVEGKNLTQNNTHNISILGTFSIVQLPFLMKMTTTLGNALLALIGKCKANGWTIVRKILVKISLHF